MQKAGSCGHLVERVVALCPRYVEAVLVEDGRVTVNLSDKQWVGPFLQILSKETVFQFQQLMDVAAVDYPERGARFELNYNLLSLVHNSRIICKLTAGEMEPVDSVAPVYPSAGWLEREIWDMYGVFFYGHLDLRRILTDYGFEGFPLRKDFPLSGYLEVRYDDTLKKILMEPLEVSQEYRFFNFVSPWERAVA